MGMAEDTVGTEGEGCSAEECMAAASATQGVVTAGQELLVIRQAWAPQLVGRVVTVAPTELVIVLIANSVEWVAAWAWEWADTEGATAADMVTQPLEAMPHRPLRGRHLRQVC